MRRSFYVLIAWMMAVSLQAQNRLSGKIADESGQALPVVTVRVLTTDSTFVKGTVTNDEGAYSFESISPGSYMLAISSVGYISQYVNFSMPASDLSMPLVTLQSDEIMLQSIEVKGTAFIRKKDYLMVIPDKQQVKHAYTGYDLLYNLMIPGVNVDRREGIVSTPRGSATLYINGVRADFHEVQNLRPKDIERIEYYDIPTGEYQGDVASVNYVTKTYKSGGYVSVDGEQNIGYLKGKYNIGAKLVHENTSYTFFGGHSMTDYDGIETMKEENISLTDYGVKRNTSHEDAQYQNNQQYAQFKINNVTPKRNLSGLVSLVRDRTPHDDITENLSYIGYNDRQLRSVEGGSQQSLKPSIGLNGIFTPTENQRIRIQLNGSYTRNKYNRSYQEEEQSSFTRVGEDLYSFSMIGIYNIRLKHKNSFGGNIQHYHNITSSSYTGDYDSWQHLWMGETILFLNYTQDIGDKLTNMVSPGGSLLNYRLHGNGLERYWTFRTNSWFRYRFNASHWLAAGYARGNNQVSLSYLNTTDQTIDFLQIKRGNPSLDNPKVSDFFFNYGGKLGAVNLQLDVTHTTYSHNVSPDYYVENNKLVSSYRSNTSYHWLKTDLLASIRFFENFRTNLKLRYEYMETSDENDLNENNYYASLEVNYFLKSFTINAYAQTTQRTLDVSSYAFMKTPASYGLVVRYNAKNWMVEAGTDNPFTKHGHYREYADYGVYRYDQIRTSRMYQQTGYIKLVYTFDFGKKTSRENNYIDKSINSAILKAQ